MRCFFYGTLRPHLLPAALAHLAASFRPLGRGAVRGRLYDLGAFPGAVLDAAAPGLVHGEVFDLPDDPDVLRLLDEYEGFDPTGPAGSLFVRRPAEVKLDAGPSLRCECYTFEGDPRGAVLIREGRWEPERPA